MSKIFLHFITLLAIGFTANAQTSSISNSINNKAMAASKNALHSLDKNIDTASFATGCFWCTEAKFQQLIGVQSVVSGYAGGHTKMPSYEQVCTGTTGHAETCNIIYVPSQISYDELLAAFFTAHDPTQLNKQGNDVGTQYRSAIFYHNAAQKAKADYYIAKLNKEKAYKSPIVTQVAPYTTFYKAEDYHQDYYNQNPQQRYCKYVIQPELETFRKVFKGKLKQQ